MPESLGGKFMTGVPIALTAAFLVGLAPARAGNLTVTIAGVRDARGTISICLFSAPRDFPDCTNDPDARRAHLPAIAGRVSTVFSDVPSGTYALSAYHDETNAGRLRTNFLGIPRDGVGASNDPRGRMGPPRFTESAFAIGPAGGAVTFSLVYP